MLTHVKTLGILNIVLSALGILAAVLVLAIFGGVAGIVGMACQDEGKLIAMPILGIIGCLIFVLVMLVSIPGLIAGVGLLKLRPWARILGVVISALNILNFPFGTALGVYGLWVLLSNETIALFEGARGR
ncbi:MAG: hypothetical protein LLG20_26235 [Acidobacteriales bacterium]|nr:hypothetical protein [Terriglobales bacterium]